MLEVLPKYMLPVDSCKNQYNHDDVMSDIMGFYIPSPDPMKLIDGAVNTPSTVTIRKKASSRARIGWLAGHAASNIWRIWIPYPDLDVLSVLDLVLTKVYTFLGNIR